ncbi:MAG: restriction endonuclease subunit R [Xenococcaceae cyanobacterium]
MATTIDASNLVLRDVHRLLNLELQLNNSFTSLLSLEPLAEIEEQRLEEIRSNFANYYYDGTILEGEVKFLLLSPLMWLAGFYHPNIRITLEEGIAEIYVEDEDRKIKGRMDILAARRDEQKNRITSLWILLIESKRIRFDTSVGLPQLLTYAYTSLEQQESVWGLTSNGKNSQFVYIQQGNPPTYQLFPELSLMYPEQSIQLLQVMKAICKPHIS